MSKITFKCKCGILLKFEHDKEIEKFECTKCNRKFKRVYDQKIEMYDWIEYEG